MLYATWTEVPTTRKTTNGRKQTATITAIETKRKTTTEAETEPVYIAATPTTKIVTTIATIAAKIKLFHYETTATNKIPEDKSQGLFSFIVTFYITFHPVLNNCNRYV